MDDKISNIILPTLQILKLNFLNFEMNQKVKSSLDSTTCTLIKIKNFWGVSSIHDYKQINFVNE